MVSIVVYVFDIIDLCFASINFTYTLCIICDHFHFEIELSSQLLSCFIGQVSCMGLCKFFSKFVNFA
jgi:hypothetical protein